MMLRLVGGVMGLVLWLAVVAGLVCAGVIGCCGVAVGFAGGGVGWEATSSVYPSVLAPGGSGTVVVAPYDVGAADSVGLVTVVDTLPAGVTAVAAGKLEKLPPDEHGESPVLNGAVWECAIDPGSLENSVVTCYSSPSLSITGGAGTWTGLGGTGAGVQPRIGMVVDVASGAPVGEAVNTVVVSGGGASRATTVSDPLQVGAGAPGFGFSRWGGWFSNADGSLDSQAGSVPYSATFSLDLNKVFKEEEFDTVGGNPRDFITEFPPGLVGDANPSAVPRCTREQLDEGKCPRDSQVGIVRAETSPNFDLTLEVFNMVPPPGVAAALAFPYEQINVFIYAGVRTGTDYGVRSRVINSPERKITGATVTLWGVPEDPSHDVWRLGNEGGCSPEDLEPGHICNLGEHRNLHPFLRLPTSCGAPLGFSIWANTWLDETLTSEASFLDEDTQGEPATLEGCGRLPFEPSIESTPTSGQADSPSGLDFSLRIPQPLNVSAVEEGGRDVGALPGLWEADLRDASVTLPAGVSVNPSSANNLAACTPEQIGLLSAPGAAKAQYTEAPARCPDAAKIGLILVRSPLLDHPLEGGVYVAEPFVNPFDSLLAIYIAVDDPESGVVVKLAGHVEPDPASGQLTTVFQENPQLPFEEFKLQFFEGSRAALRTPAVCGSYQTSSVFTPWSAPEGATASPTSAFQVNEPAAGTGACPRSPGEEPDQPSLQAGPENPVGGVFSPLLVALSREDGSQELERLSLTLAPGMTGKIAGIPWCPEAGIEQAENRSHAGEGVLEQNDPSCPAASELGTATVAAGAGETPYYTTGRVYLAGPYQGAPFDIVTITPAVAGPYDLGTVVVRTPVTINPTTAQVTATSNPLPVILDGIPLDIRSIHLDIDRPEFALNPTNCSQQTSTGQVTTTQNQTAHIESSFYPTECAKLRFKPTLTATVAGQGSKRDGTTFKVKLESKGIGQANIQKVDLTIPAILPSRQSTIEKACPDQTFNTNPAACDEGSLIGEGTLHTPLLAQPLHGPAILVSHAAAAFPDVEFVLQGENGIHITIDGKTDIKHGITYSRFETNPDDPFTLFEATLPAGPHSALTTYVPEKENYNLCKHTITMPTTIVAQSNTTIEQSTHITTTGCYNKTPTKLRARLKRCRTRYKHSKRQRLACERRARHKGKSSTRDNSGSARGR
jgi:hypothetical protein